MKTAELIKTARQCGQRPKDCKGCPLDGREDCLVYLSGQLADKLEMAVMQIPRNCGTCERGSEEYGSPKCKECLTMPYRKNWKWRGDRDE